MSRSCMPGQPRLFGHARWIVRVFLNDSQNTHFTFQLPCLSRQLWMTAAKASSVSLNERTCSTVIMSSSAAEQTADSVCIVAYVLQSSAWHIFGLKGCMEHCGMHRVRTISLQRNMPGARKRCGVPLVECWRRSCLPHSDCLW
ncbi:hypothetical protein IscW_ISCW010804 [Ixodes scapularis]|uniref:Uncharacterized protein n=1 Tax=Ixodes scapularis TaxID=6945 RepID=B7Q6C3_IXOSC|nr:hypothetical protein IscW_ISCW010804 [Ixodes scapularis]|eukprot:XP_002402871.1 hypothetical protein IscW_ISCW010804 [Ixodes scapularis]